jgi:hypothetical protein
VSTKARHARSKGIPHVHAEPQPEEFGEFVKSEVRKWSKVVRDAGMQPQ